MKRPATIFFKCPKCGSTDIRNVRSGKVDAHVCYGCGHKWGGTSDYPKNLYRLFVAANVVWSVIFMYVVVKYVDLNGITGDFSRENPYLGLNNFKIGFT